MNIIETANITKRFKPLTALDNISIRVGEGEIYGFLGLNGAGKTTLIRILLGMVTPTAGAVKLFGKSLDKRFDRWNSIGYLVETPCAYPNLSVVENLHVYHSLRQLTDKKLIANIIERLNLAHYADTKAKHLSLGNQQRLGLAKALMHSPKLLILDEPVNGLDPEGIVEIRGLLKELSASGTTVFLSSHILGEISKLASRIAIIHYGKLLDELNADELHERLIKKTLVKTNDNKRAAACLNAAQYHAALGDGEIAVSDKKAVEKPEEVAKRLVENGFSVKQLYVFTENLEQYFLRTIRGKENV
ncbi:MAG: ABC transporter ATP-binding protein [Prevotellaceae bacterium]|jgi:ABC-2 type transport system ATP-binding protein|nr:ABC transporter ATP-binding protein [Prevotellaceae bacterium]